MVAHCWHRAERIGHGVLKAEYFFLIFCSLSSGIGLQDTGCGLWVAGCEVRVARCRVCGMVALGP